MKNDKMGPVQNFAFGGIANPTQRATLRPSDRAYLEARQRELDAYERQRLAYNKALADYQSREQTEEFGMAAPVLPFKEADVAARQQQAAQRARRDAGNRAAAIDVVSDPKKFGFSSFALSDRFMAEGGEVRGYAEGGEVDEDDEAGVGEVGSAKALLAQLEAQAPRPAKRAPAPKRMAARSDGAAMPKGMGMEQESLGSVRELVKMATEKGSARQQMEELARLYQLKITAAQNRSRGMAASTFGAPTLETPTMTKNTLATKRFKKGGEAISDPEAALFEGRGDVPAPARSKVLDEILGAGETALTLGTGAASSLVGMPYGLYKGLTSGKYLEGKAADIAGKEAAAFMERNTYVPRTESARENLAAIGKAVEPLKFAPAPGGAAIASIPRTAALAQAERLGMAAEKKLEGPVTRIMERGGKAADLLGSFGTQPSRAVRPTGSVINLANSSTRVLDDGTIVRRSASPLRVILDEGKAGAGVSVSTPVLPNIQQFWDKKARNYFEKQFGTPDDPIADALISGKIKGDAISDIENFPSYITEATLKGKTREREAGPGVTETRFFPEFPKAIEDLTRRYDTATGLGGMLVTNEPELTNLDFANILGNLGVARQRATSAFIEDKMIGQGVRPELINTQTSVVARSQKDPTKIVGPEQGKKLLEEYEKSLRGEATTLPTSTLTAIQKGEPIYDALTMQPIVKQLFNPERVNKYLETLPPREIDSMRFEDVITNTNKMFLDKDSLDALVARIRAGKRVPDSVFSDGVSAPLLQFDKNSGFDGFAWKRIEKRTSTIPEGAYVGHSVGGYETGGAGYPKEKMDGFNTGKYQVYTLRDNRNRPVNTVEVFMVDEDTPVVTQIKGNGRASGNTAPVDYDKAILDFFDKYLKPAAVQEKDELLTPLLQQYKNGINAGFKMP